MKNENETINDANVKRGRPVEIEVQEKYLSYHAVAVRKIEGRLGEVDLKNPMVAFRLAARLVKHLTRMMQIQEVITTNS